MYLNKPYYVFRPTQLLRRLKRTVGRRPADSRESVSLPWGLPITVDPLQPIGSALVRSGVYDLCVCEAVYRLADPGEVAVDAGANIGLMASVMAAKLGSSGTVLAFEPHPTTFGELLLNVETWRACEWAAPIEPRLLALSDREGRGTLVAGRGEDLGQASLNSSGAAEGRHWEADLARLDDLVEDRVGVLKLDVEGHEAKALIGAERLLRERKIRDIVFEEHEIPPTPATELLEQHGYSVFRLEQRLLGPRISKPASAADAASDYPPSYLATVERERAEARLSRRGWMVLSAGRRGAPRLEPVSG
jgi:FkbM family methyltransferase